MAQRARYGVEKAFNQACEYLSIAFDEERQYSLSQEPKNRISGDALCIAAAIKATAAIEQSLKFFAKQWEGGDALRAKVFDAKGRLKVTFRDFLLALSESEGSSLDPNEADLIGKYYSEVRNPAVHSGQVPGYRMAEVLLQITRRVIAAHYPGSQRHLSPVSARWPTLRRIDALSRWYERMTQDVSPALPSLKEVAFEISGERSKSRVSVERASKLVEEILTKGTEYDRYTHANTLLAADILGSELKVSQKVRERVASRAISEALETPYKLTWQQLACCLAEMSGDWRGMSRLLELKDDDTENRRARKALLQLLFAMGTEAIRVMGPSRKRRLSRNIAAELVSAVACGPDVREWLEPFADSLDRIGLCVRESEASRLMLVSREGCPGLEVFGLGNAVAENIDRLQSLSILAVSTQVDGAGDHEAIGPGTYVIDPTKIDKKPNHLVFELLRARGLRRTILLLLIGLSSQEEDLNLGLDLLGDVLRILVDATGIISGYNEARNPAGGVEDDRWSRGESDYNLIQTCLALLEVPSHPWVWGWDAGFPLVHALCRDRRTPVELRRKAFRHFLRGVCHCSTLVDELEDESGEEWKKTLKDALHDRDEAIQIMAAGEISELDGYAILDESEIQSLLDEAGPAVRMQIARLLADNDCLDSESVLVATEAIIVGAVNGFWDVSVSWLDYVLEIYDGVESPEALTSIEEVLISTLERGMAGGVYEAAETCLFDGSISIELSARIKELALRLLGGQLQVARDLGLLILLNSEKDREEINELVSRLQSASSSALPRLVRAIAGWDSLSEDILKYLLTCLESPDQDLASAAACCLSGCRDAKVKDLVAETALRILATNASNGFAFKVLWALEGYGDCPTTGNSWDRRVVFPYSDYGCTIFSCADVMMTLEV